MEIVRKVKLFECDKKATDGSIMPKDVVMKYLMSDTYAEDNKNNLILGGITHKDRYGDKSYKGLGIDDPALINKNITHRLNDLYIEGSWVCGTLTIFDPDNFVGEAKENIAFLQGLVLSGVAVTGSVVIDGDWNKKGVLKELNKIVGWDATLNPSYKGAGSEN